jgi:hypothetical protein
MQTNEATTPVRCARRWSSTEDYHTILVIGSRVEVGLECSTKGQHGKVVELTHNQVGVLLDDGTMHRYAPLSLLQDLTGDDAWTPRPTIMLMNNPYVGNTYVGHRTTPTNRTAPMNMVSDTGSHSGISLSQEHTMATVEDHNSDDHDTSVELSIAQVLSDEFTIDLDEMKTIMRRFAEIKLKRAE